MAPRPGWSFDRLAADDFAALPRDNVWFGAMAALAETAATLGLAEEALRLHAQLAPFAGRNIVTPTVAFLGPVEMWLGILARVAGRGEQALEHLARARTAAARNGDRMTTVRLAVEEATVLVDHGGADERERANALVGQATADCDAMGRTSMRGQLATLSARLAGGLAGGAPAEPASLAPRRAAAPAPEPRREAAGPSARRRGAGATLRREGDIWTIEDGRTSLQLANGKGVRLLALLLEHPGREMHSLELEAILDGSVAPAGPSASGGQETAGSFGVQGGTGPRLDATAKAAYRARLKELRAEISEAVALGDNARAERAREELGFVSRELDLAVGLGGRDRKEHGSHAERARVNITRAIRSTVKRIAGYDARLGRELESAIKTGAFCVYEPDPRHVSRWAVEDADGA